MNTFLLIISLLLNGIAIFLIFILYARQNRLVQVEKKQEKIIQEMEDTISTYLVEMKEENERFFKKLALDSSQTVTRQSVPNAKKVPPTPYPKKVTSAVNQKLDEDILGLIDYTKTDDPVIKTKEVRQESVPIQHTSKTIKEQSLLSQVLLLEAEGYSEEAIAKKLNKGKTEIQLMLKFNRKE